MIDVMETDQQMHEQGKMNWNNRSSSATAWWSWIGWSSAATGSTTCSATWRTFRCRRRRRRAPSGSSCRTCWPSRCGCCAAAAASWRTAQASRRCARSTTSRPTWRISATPSASSTGATTPSFRLSWKTGSSIRSPIVFFSPQRALQASFYDTFTLVRFCSIVDITDLIHGILKNKMRNKNKND